MEIEKSNFIETAKFFSFFFCFTFACIYLYQPTPLSSLRQLLALPLVLREEVSVEASVYIKTKKREKLFIQSTTMELCLPFPPLCEGVKIDKNVLYVFVLFCAFSFLTLFQ
jgi:hypothetical protein